MTAQVSNNPGVPLEGLRVLEVGHYIAGPHCTQILSDWGARVVKLERPTGDPGRASGTQIKGNGLYFAVQNRGKESLAMDLKSAGGRDAIRRLIRWADVVVSNYSPAALEKLDLAYPTLRELNPAVILIQASGFGSAGEFRDWVAFDSVIQAMSGLVDMTGQPDGPPTIPGYFIADHLAGIYSALAAMGAIIERYRTGEGQCIDVSMLDCLVSIGAYPQAISHVPGGHLTRRGNLPGHSAPIAVYPALDGYVSVCAMTDKMWRKVTEVMGLADLAADRSLDTRVGRRAARERIDGAIIQWTSSRTRQEIASLLQASGVAAGPVNAVGELEADPRVAARMSTTQLECQDGTIIAGAGPAVMTEGMKAGLEAASHRARIPGLGEHSAEILSELGYDSEQISSILAGN